MPALQPDPNRQPPIASGTGDPVADSDALLNAARGIEDQGGVDVAAAEIDASYSAALDEIVEAKQDQADRIEDQLENMIEAQTARLQQAQARQPGMLALPGAWQKWQA